MMERNKIKPDTKKQTQKPKKKKNHLKNKKILVWDNSNSTIRLDNKTPQPKKEKREKRNEIALLGIVRQNKFLIMTIAELSDELKLSPSVILTVLQQKGIKKGETEKLSFEEYSIVKKVINHRIFQLIRQLKQEKWVLDSRIRKKSEKPSYAAKKSSVFDEIAKYGLGKVIYIKSK